MTDEKEHDHQDDCLMCAVRALTEGVPPTWAWTQQGDNVTGVVLAQGEVVTDFGPIPYVDLWRGGFKRIRVMAYAGSLRHAISAAAPQIGDTLTVWYDGQREVQHRGQSRNARMFSANAQRGHGR